MKCVRARSAVPLALTCAYALWTFWPDRASMPGWGGDPLFVLWVFEHAWRQMDRLGPLHLWSDRFWSAPIFAGLPLQLAFSENLLYPALILRPLWRAAGGPLALQWGAIGMTVASFGCALGFLRSIGLREMAAAGALLFACCGFVQSQYAHYQNLCIFLLPLAAWSWSALEKRPDALRTALCALAFGWIGGWNMYFQLFATLALVALVVARRPVPVRWRALALLGALLVQAPIAIKYVALQSVIGRFDTSITYGAVARSFLGTALRPTLLQRILPGYPSTEVPIEAAGFLGFSWAALVVAGLLERRARPWSLLALLAFWAALGFGYGLFDVIHLLPGFSGLRATGRFQVLTALFAVPAALLVAQQAAGVFRWVPLALAILELLPATPALRVPVPRELDSQTTELDLGTRGRGPVLAVPTLDPRLQLYLVRSAVPLLQGVSGREPANVQLLDAMLAERPWTAQTLPDVLAMTRVPSVVATDPRWIAELSGSASLEPRGCVDAFDLRVCTFQPREVSERSALRLGRDATWDYDTSAAGWPVARLRATRAGVLDYFDLGRCRLAETTRLGILSWTRELTFPGTQLLAARFEPGGIVFLRESRQAIFRLPRWGRPTRTYAVRCG
jgi:hypothetical protein